MPNSNASISGDPTTSLPQGFVMDDPKAAFDPTQTIIDTANKYGIDPNLALKIAHQESGINPNVRDSSAGAMGIMQLMSGTARDLGVNPRDPVQNIDGGVRYLKQLQDQFGNNPAIVAGAYNGGPGRMRSFLAGRGSLPSETQNYIVSVGNSPVSAKALGYTAAPQSPSAQSFIASPTGSAPAPAAAGGADDWIAAPGASAPSAGTPTAADPATSLPPGFQIDSAARTDGGADDWIKAASIDLEWAKQALRNWPALASPMLTYLPNAAWLKEIVDRGQTPRKRKSYDKYHADAEVTVGAAQARHRGFKQKVDNGTATDFDHLMEITTDAEAAACEHHLGARDPVQRRIFERQLNAMVWFQCLLMTPGAGMTDPREDGEPTLKQRRREQERDESFSAY